MSLDTIRFQILFFAFIYMILALQVSNGFPPFYIDQECKSYSLIEQKKYEIYRDLKTAFPYFIALFVSMLLIGLTGSPIFVLSGAVFAFLIGLDRRKHMKTRIGHPQKWLMNISPLLNIFMLRYPMGLFDLWTSGIVFLFGGIIILSNITN